MFKKTIPLVAAIAVAVTPVAQGAMDSAKSNQFWWPDQLDLGPLRQHSPDSDPMGEEFNYAEAFAKLDLD